MTQNDGRVAAPNRLSSDDGAPTGLHPTGFDPARDEDPYWDDDDGECWTCGGEGFVYGCSWDWQCDTYDAGEGTCLCTRACDACRPRKPDPELQQVLANALRDSDRSGEAIETPESGSASGESAGRRHRQDTDTDTPQNSTGEE